METVAAGPESNGHDRAGRKAVVGIVTVGDDAKFLGSVGVWEGRGQRHIGVHVGRAVEHIEGASLTSASGPRRRWHRETSSHPDPGLAVSERHHAGAEKHQA